MRDLDRDPTLAGTSSRPTTGAPPATGRQQTDQQSGGGMDAGQMKDKAAQAAGQAKEKAGEMAHSATQAIDDRREQASSMMGTAAEQLRERGESLPGGERTTEMAAMAADKVEATSTYIREHDVNDMMTDLETLVRNHPTQSLIAAAAAGFLVGRMLRG